MNLKKDDFVDFRVLDDSHIGYGKRVCEVKHTQGISPEEFVHIYEALTSEYGLLISEDFLSCFYNKRLSQEKRLESPFPYIKHLAGFVLDSHYLLDQNVDIKPLVKEFNNCRSSSELHHTFHLSGLAANYAFKGYSIKFPVRSGEKKSADLIIDEVSADLKVIGPSDREKLHSRKGDTFASKLSEDLCYDIGKAIENRLCHGIKQADLIFIDLASKSLPLMYLESMTNTFLDKEYNVLLPEPRSYRVIYYCMSTLPSNLNRRKEGLPYSFYGTYIDIDSNLWKLIKSNDVQVVHEKGEGMNIL